MNSKASVFSIINKLRESNRKQRKAFFRDMTVDYFEDILQKSMDEMRQVIVETSTQKVKDNIKDVSVTLSEGTVKEALKLTMVQLHRYAKEGKRMDAFMDVFNEHLNQLRKSESDE